MSGRTFTRAAAALCFAALFTTAAPARALEPEPTRQISRETAADLVRNWMMNGVIGGVTAAWSALTSSDETAPIPIEIPDPPGIDEGWLVDPNG